MEDVGLSGLTLQRDSFKCLVQIPHWQLGNYLLSTRESYGPTAKMSARHIYVNV